MDTPYYCCWCGRLDIPFAEAQQVPTVPDGGAVHKYCCGAHYVLAALSNRRSCFWDLPVEEQDERKRMRQEDGSESVRGS